MTTWQVVGRVVLVAGLLAGAGCSDDGGGDRSEREGEGSTTTEASGGALPTTTLPEDATEEDWATAAQAALDELDAVAEELAAATEGGPVEGEDAVARCQGTSLRVERTLLALDAAPTPEDAEAGRAVATTYLGLLDTCRTGERLTAEAVAGAGEAASTDRDALVEAIEAAR